MNSSPQSYDELINHIRGNFAEIFSQSKQGISIYLDDPHWICNDQLAILLGYSSSDELLKIAAKSSFLETCVSEESTERVSETYAKTINQKVASVIPVKWKKKGQGTVKAEVIIVPFSVHGN